VTFTDPLNFQTTFSYDGPARDLLQILYPSNPSNAFVTNVYDARERVSQQSNAAGNTTDFYWPDDISMPQRLRLRERAI
jgi:hypothetical protein